MRLTLTRPEWPVLDEVPTQQRHWFTLLPMHDADIRRALDLRLRKKFLTDSTTVIRHELGVCAGRRRVDVALINGHLEGFEIKSDYDSLARLEGQVAAYSAVLDRSWLVAGERHLDRALPSLPQWWGIMRAARRRDGSVRLTEVRRPKRSPELDAMSTAQLLWRDEALNLLQTRGLARGLSGKARWYVWDRLASSLGADELRAAVRDQLRARQVWPGGQPPT